MMPRRAKGEDSEPAVQESVLDEKAAGDEAGPSDEKEVDEDEVDEGELHLYCPALAASIFPALRAILDASPKCLHKQLD